MIPQYRQAMTVKKKSKLLDAFTATTGYNRKYACGSSIIQKRCKQPLSTFVHAITGQRSNTRAGTLLKQQIPVRTFEEWEETRPGFLGVDLVAHCGTDIKGGYLYTLMLTDITTGWTECLPLMHRREVPVLAALQRARTLFPFPILGIDIDNGGECINEVMVAYCEQEQITFTPRAALSKKRSMLCGAEKWSDCATGGRL
jgi:hypothetical protein